MSGPTISRWFCPRGIGRDEAEANARRSAKLTGRAQAFHPHGERDLCGDSCQLIHPCGAAGPISGGIAPPRRRPILAPELAAALAANRNGYGD